MEENEIVVSISGELSESLLERMREQIYCRSSASWTSLDGVNHNYNIPDDYLYYHNKQIDQLHTIQKMAEYINKLDKDEEICSKVKLGICEKYNNGNCEECIIQYFKNL